MVKLILMVSYLASTNPEKSSFVYTRFLLKLKEISVSNETHHNLASFQYRSQCRNESNQNLLLVL